MPLRFKRLSRFRWPRISLDLNQAADRRRFVLGCLGVLFLGTVVLIGSYEGYHYTESSEFCGTACHPMAPQFDRYEASPHANVECAQCHIGPGASFFVKSKIDGIRQVIAVMFDTYDRPIRSPVHDLRPAREICEQCHSPATFRDNIIKNVLHYSSDEENTPIKSTFILKMGGWEEYTGISEGIHWHITAPVYYIAADEQRQIMLWVGVEQPDGSMKEFFSRDMMTMAQTNFVEKAYASGQVRLMDCIDCHNRTAHLIPPPDVIVDQALRAGKISTDLPYIRRLAVEILSPEYPTRQAGYEAIERLFEFYQQQYPEVYRTQEADIRAAVEELKRIFDQSQFPDMNLSWATNPDNVRHTPFPGCFRCHDDKHVSIDETGKEVDVISVKCNLCHTVPIVGSGDELTVEAPVITGAVPESHSDFRFTVEHRDVTEEQKQTECYQCHGQSFCNNSACHNLSHPEDMVFTHAEEYAQRGERVCYTCHQNFVLCSRCHPGGIVENP